MRITDIDVYPLAGGHGLLLVSTDEGITGWGSCFMPPSLVRASLEYLSDLIVGQDPIQVDKVVETLHNSAFWFGRGGVITTFISGVDIALWDIRGKALGLSVSKLLGARYREAIKPYASMSFSPPEQLEERLETAYAKGFRAFKLGWAPFGRLDTRNDELLIKRARKTIGDDCDLMVDAGGSGPFWHNDLKWAINAARMLKEYEVLWFEEPLADQNLEGHARLKEASPVWIATGECLRQRQAFIPWIDRAAVDVLQPDLTTVGGISEGRRIAWAAADHGVHTIFHGWNTAIGLAADLQLSAALPHSRFVEYHTPSPYIDDILTDPFQVNENGLLAIPDAPGLGVEIDRERVKRLAADTT